MGCAKLIRGERVGVDRSAQGSKSADCKMNPRNGGKEMGRLDSPKDLGSKPEIGPKGPCKGLLGSVSGFERYSADRRFGRFESVRGPLKPQPADVIHYGLADDSAKNAMEMVLRKAGDIGQLVRRQLLIQMLLNVFQHL
jgi:hypothetical protein